MAANAACRRSSVARACASISSSKFDAFRVERQYDDVFPESGTIPRLQLSLEQQIWDGELVGQSQRYLEDISTVQVHEDRRVRDEDQRHRSARAARS